MPYMSKINGAITSTLAKKGALEGKAAWIDIGTGPIQIYDGRPKPAFSVGGGWSDGVTSLSWSNASIVAQFIRIERKLGTGSWGTIVDFLPVTTTSYNDNLTVNGTYYYRVIPYNDWGNAPAYEHTVIVSPPAEATAAVNLGATFGADMIVAPYATINGARQYYISFGDGTNWILESPNYNTNYFDAFSIQAVSQAGTFTIWTGQYAEIGKIPNYEKAGTLTTGQYTGGNIAFRLQK